MTNTPIRWAAAPADLNTEHLYTGPSSLCGHSSRPRAAGDLRPAPVGLGARCERCQRLERNS